MAATARVLLLTRHHGRCRAFPPPLAHLLSPTSPAPASSPVTITGHAAATPCASCRISDGELLLRPVLRWEEMVAYDGGNEWQEVHGGCKIEEANYRG